MRCVKCQSDNPEGAKFCQECGTKLLTACPQCGHQVTPTAKFCAECGESLTGKAKVKRQKSKNKSENTKDKSQGKNSDLRPFHSPDSELRTPDTGRSSAERRQLTVMFCDLVGSTALSAQLDPEELREVIGTYHHTCAAIIKDYDGHIAQYLGDGLLVYFGYPVAHEDDALRAVRVGLKIVDAMQEQVTDDRLQRERRLQVRIGLHTGLVVIGDIGGSGRTEQLAVGETPNVAARIQGLAEPNTIVLSDATYRLIEGFFDCHVLGAQEIKGITTPMELYRIEGERRTVSRLEVAAARGLTPLIGRDEEVELLLKRWQLAKEGEGQVVLLQGEAGIGKSRLLQVLRERVSEEPYTRLECRCAPFTQNSAFYPMIELLQRVLQFSRADTPEVKLHKLETALDENGKPTHDLMPFFASMLSLPTPAQYPALSLTPQKQKEKIQQAVLTWLLTEAHQRPVCFAVEDVHWADPSTLEFLALLLDQTTSARVMVLLTARPEFAPPWAMAAHITHLALRRLSRRQVETMVERLAGLNLSAEMIQQLVTRTDGVPLFVEELTKATLEVDVTAAKTTAGGQQIPSTLQDSLMARLDRLSTAKEIAQLGATIGREFSYELVRAITPLDDAKLKEALTKLVGTELLQQRGTPPHARYLFKHALIQDAAYQSLLKSTRQQYHRQIAHVLAQQFPETQETQPELLAHHYTEAGVIEQAIPLWQQAGQRAMQRSANIEAIRHFSAALELLSSLPDTPARATTELSLLLLRAVPLIATQGYASPVVKQSYERAQEVCEQVTDTHQLFRALWGMALFYTNAGQNRLAHQFAQRCMVLAEQEQDLSLLLQAHFFIGALIHWFGELNLAKGHLTRALELYELERDRSLALTCGLDPAMGSAAYGALNLWYLGYPDQALTQADQALYFAERVAHPLSQCFAHGYITLIHFFRGEHQRALQEVLTLARLAEEQRFQHYQLMASLFRGVLLVELGTIEEGERLARTTSDTMRKVGTAGGRSMTLSFLAEVSRRAGHVDAGLEFVDRGLRVSANGEDVQSEAELYRLKGELTLQQLSVVRSQLSVPSLQAEAEGYFLKAIEVARKQAAKSLELRATMSLARLWSQQGKKVEAHRMLSAVYEWFTEGFDTKDLQDAKALLDRLAEG